MRRAVATAFGIGSIPVLPGLWAALAAIVVAWGLHWAGGFAALALAAVLVFAAGLWAVKGADEGRPEIVIDAVLGIWVALLLLSAGLSMADAERHVFPWPGWLGALALVLAFRLWRPGPIAWAERRGGAVGVMLGGLVAGVLAAVLLTLAAALAHGWLV